MNKFLHGVARAVTESFDLPEPIVEIGAYQVAGQESLINLRSLFGNKSYTGLDMRAGPGVDCVADVESLPYETGSAGTVVAMSTFEHVPHFWRGFDEVFRVLRPDGVLFVSCPFYFHIHNHPSDYWRFTPEALQVLLVDYPQRIMGWHGPKNRPASVWSVAFREECPAVSIEQLARYESLMERYAREPIKRRRELRYRLASLLCGGGPFAPYLKQNSWNVEFHNAAAAGLLAETAYAADTQTASRRKAA
ncbi:MAG TPA: class I SAM-dependent methyltransferase [Pirellulales bacterium]|nr:class I SAM-dependent methyltransferase [Pirellulales bacterium]